MKPKFFFILFIFLISAMLFFPLFTPMPEASELSQEPEEISSVSPAGKRELLRSSIVLPAQLAENPHIKILILQNQDQLTLSIPFPYAVESVPDSKILERGSLLSSAKIVPAAGGIQIGRAVYNQSHLKLATENQYFDINGKQFHGDVEITKTPSGKLNVINEVQMEDYLKGVLPWEVSEKWRMEALKAQAVVARTFAIFKILERAGQTHILTSDVLSQVYAGKSVEKLKTNRAVDATRGEVLLFRKQIFPAFFHAHCGGQTTQADYVWRIQPNPVLNGTICLYCKGSKYDRWESSVSLDKIEAKIRARGFTISPIRTILFSDYDPSGRARKVIIEHTKGTLTLDANDFRLFVGPDLIRSTKATVDVTRHQKAEFSGQGWGHGVGMCQWGSKAQAELGRSYQEILAFYYPGSKLQKLYGGKNVPLLSASPGDSSDVESDGLLDKAERLVNDWFG